MIESFAPVAIFLFVALIFPGVPLLLGHFLRPQRPNPVKLRTYESGVETIGPTHIQFRTRYYLYALVFVVFDVEAVFLFPWAATYGQLGLFALVEMAVFIGILLLGYWYAWRKRALEWT